MEAKAKKHSQFRIVWRRLKKNKLSMIGLLIVCILGICAVFAEFIAPYPYDKMDLLNTFQMPCKEHLLGTDNFGYDILSRLIYGSRVSLIVGFISVGIGLLFGGVLGSVSAFYGGKTDNFIMRIMDVMMSIPDLLLAISIAASMGPGLTNAMIAVGISSIPSYARIVRASVLSTKENEYIEAARAIGAGDGRIILKHIIPNSFAPVLVQATLGVANAILVTSALSFIGLGIQPPKPEWGAMLAAGRSYIRDFWPIVTFPGIAIMITIIALNLLGDGLRDALDPRLKQ
jgi:peptide/nickel transport system permease protein